MSLSKLGLVIAYAEERGISFWNYTRQGIVAKGALGAGYNITKKVNINLSDNIAFARHGLERIGTLNLGLNYNF
jgi:hypothetical protein